MAGLVRAARACAPRRVTMSQCADDTAHERAGLQHFHDRDCSLVQSISSRMHTRTLNPVLAYGAPTPSSARVSMRKTRPTQSRVALDVLYGRNVILLDCGARH